MRATCVVAAAGVLSLITHFSAPAAGAPVKSNPLIRVVQSSITFAQASVNAQVDECRRMALQEQGDSIAMFDSGATKDKQQAELWYEKTRTLIEAYKKYRIPVGRFGDATVFDSIRRSPSQVATAISADVDAALRAVTQNLKVIESQLKATPNDPVLYCDYVFVQAHKNVLQYFSRYATIHKLLLDAIERHFRLQIRNDSSISKSEYEKTRAKISETLLDLYTHEQQSSDRTQIMLKQLLKQ